MLSQNQKNYELKENLVEGSSTESPAHPTTTMTSSFSYDLLLTVGRNTLRSLTTNIFWVPTLQTQKIAASTGKIFGISETHSSTRFTLEYDIARPHWFLRCLLSMSRATLWTFLTSLSLSSLSKMMRRIISMCTASSLNNGSRCTWMDSPWIQISS